MYAWPLQLPNMKNEDKRTFLNYVMVGSHNTNRVLFVVGPVLSSLIYLSTTKFNIQFTKHS